MRLTTKSQYGFRALELLVRNWHEDGNGYLRMSTFSTHCDTSAKYLEHVLLPLAQAGILDSKRGQHGGYRLSRPPETISLAEVVRHLEGRLMPIPAWAEENAADPSQLIGVLRRVREVLRSTLEATTIAILAQTDLAETEPSDTLPKDGPEEAPMYYI